MFCCGIIADRNNKLTQLMQDSLGGNAKTLMFVNFSPAIYNVEETLGSLSYAARTKQIKNAATTNTETAEVVRLKRIIAELKVLRALTTKMKKSFHFRKVAVKRRQRKNEAKVPKRT